MNVGEERRARRRSVRPSPSYNAPTPATPESNGHINEIERPVQYAQRGDSFQPVGKTIKTLTSGSYLLVKKDDGSGSFLGFEPINIMTDELLRFQYGCFKDVIDDITWFWKSSEEYSSYGFSHKRGYLLHGPPGSGKTCLVNLIIKDVIALGGIAFIVEHLPFIDKLVPQFRFVEPERPLLVVLEDVESAIGKSLDENNERNLLAILDGETQINHVAFVATSNHPGQLEQRFWNRPGRFDRVVKIDIPSDELRHYYLTKKLGTTKGPDGIDLVKETTGLSLGHLRELIVGIYLKKEDPKSVIKRLKDMKTRPQGEDGGGSMGYGMGGKDE